MQIKLLIRISICAIVICFLSFSSTTVLGYQMIQSSNEKTKSMYYDVDIDIRAGIFNKTNGEYGFGFLVNIKNNLERFIHINYTVYWNTMHGKSVRYDRVVFNLGPLFDEIQFKSVDWLHFPFPILKLQVIVIVDEISTSVSRSGVEIGPFVFFSRLNS